MRLKMHHAKRGRAPERYMTGLTHAHVHTRCGLLDELVGLYLTRTLVVQPNPYVLETRHIAQWGTIKIKYMQFT